MGKKIRSGKQERGERFELRLNVLGSTHSIRDLLSVAPSACSLIQTVLTADDPEATMAAHWLAEDVGEILRAADALLEGRAVEVTERQIDEVDPIGQAVRMLSLLRVEHPDGHNHLEPARNAQGLIAERLEREIRWSLQAAEARA